ncbi:MAG TPA: hypothetical protein VFW87_23435 [Pirellulales bacterium]|nr:hypothetical protein [Pirellulales bacterium]
MQSKAQRAAPLNARGLKTRIGITMILTAMLGMLFYRPRSATETLSGAVGGWRRLGRRQRSYQTIAESTKMLSVNNQEAPMSQQIYHGVIQGGQVRLLDAVLPIPEGTPVLVTALPAPAGTGAAVIAAADSAPRVPAAWVDELEQLIHAGERSAERSNPFAERSSG